MINYRQLVSESIDILQAHTECAVAGIPLPDKPLPNLRKTHFGWAYDKPGGGYIFHALEDWETGNPYVGHYNDNHDPHRIGGPAIHWTNGSKAWCVNGCEIGSVYRFNGTPNHWYGQRKVSQEEFKKRFMGYDEKL